MIDLHRHVCARHRGALLAFVDSGESTPLTEPALTHLDGCARCMQELERTVLAITALRRWGDEVSTAEPPDDAWPRLRERIDRWRPVRSAAMSPIFGMAMSVAIVAVLVVPLSLGGAGFTVSGPPSNRPTAADALELVVDRSRPIALSTTSTPVAAIDLAGWAGPDGLGVQDSSNDRPIQRRIGSGGPL